MHADGNQIAQRFTAKNRQDIRHAGPGAVQPFHAIANTLQFDLDAYRPVEPVLDAPLFNQFEKAIPVFLPGHLRQKILHVTIRKTLGQLPVKDRSEFLDR